MAGEQRILKQDGYLEVGNNFNDDGAGGAPIESRYIAYHPQMNVIILFETGNQVKVLDVHSGIVLQTYTLGEPDRTISGHYMPLQEKLLIWDGHNLGLRGDYNGVLLLDTVLQAPISSNDDLIKLELLLSEAIIFQTCLKDLEQEGLEVPTDLTNELGEKIKIAQATAKKSIKAQRWNTICLEIPYSSLKLVANNVVAMLRRLERQIPALAIASAINERLTDLLIGGRVTENWTNVNLQRVLMHSEAVRRQTFEKWPHMDYKWALPDQMAQAGFFHQPSTSGEDRAMCFTCSVCLVCWEKTDEPWSEHERHSPLCPFVKGEYTQNVPVAVTYATNPALTAAGQDFDVISNSDYANVLCTSCTQTGDITIWSTERQLKPMHTFNIATLMKDICDESYEWVHVTAICVLPNERAEAKLSAMSVAQAGGTTGNNTGVMAQCTSTSTLRDGVVGSKLVLGLSIRQSTGEHLLRLAVLSIVPNDRLLDSVVGNEDTVTEANKTKSGLTSLTNESNKGNNIFPGGGDGVSLTDQYIDSLKSLKKYADSFGSNGFVQELMGLKKSGGSGDKLDTSTLTNMFSDGGLICDLPELTHMLEKAHDGSEGITSALQLNSNANDIEMDANYFKEKLLAAADAIKHNNNNQNDNNNLNEDTMIKTTVCEDIECVVDSCISVLRTQNTERLDGGVKELDEITEILPTNPKCEQLLVKLLKKKPAKLSASKIIMAAMEELEDEPTEQDEQDLNPDDLAAQLLVFDYVDSAISNEYSLAVAFSRAKCPQQMIVLPSFQMNAERRNSLLRVFESGALCVVCADGTIEIYSLVDFQLITTIEEEAEHFVSVAYCRSLERLCGCTRYGSLIFYSLNDADNESGDEMLEGEEELTAGPNIDVSVTDGTNGTGFITGGGGGGVLSNITNTMNMNDGKDTHVDQVHLTASNIGIDCSSQGLGVNNPIGSQASPSPSLGSNNSGPTNLLAYKAGDYTMEDLRTLYDLTLFDNNLSFYTAEVPSCWNDLGQAQKQRKQSSNMRVGDDTQFTKTWRLHNDATTWDEHIIELNLAQPVSLGHIDFRFTLYQQCHNPAAIQITLLKQNTSGFGYRMKGPHTSYKQADPNDNLDAPHNQDGTAENPVISEEYLQTHNAEILAGPIELSSCIDLNDQGGIVTLTSPKLFKTRTRNFLLHIKTMGDPAKDGHHSKTRVNIQNKFGLLRALSATSSTSTSSSNANEPNPNSKKAKINSNIAVQAFKSIKKSFSTSYPKIAYALSPKKQVPKPPPKPQTKPPPAKPRTEPIIGCDWLHEISISVRGVKNQSRIPNERQQRIAMLESNTLVDNLFKIVTNPEATMLFKNLALDILVWICFIRLNRYRSPKSERIKEQITKATAATTTDLMAQQFECISISEKYLEEIMRSCIIRGGRTMAHKCVKLILILTEGICGLPLELQNNATLDLTMKDAVQNTFIELPDAKYASAARWYSMLVCATSTMDSHNGISESCVDLLMAICDELNNRWDPYGALLGTRFGLYGFPFEPEIFDYDYSNPKTNFNITPAMVNVIRTTNGLIHPSCIDIKKIYSIDGVDFRSFPYLIKSKSVSNQLRGLLEVEQLHFTCSATSEATRIDNMDAVLVNGGGSSLNMEDLIMTPMPPNPEDMQQKHIENDKLTDFVNNVQNYIVDKQMKLGTKKGETDMHVSDLKPNGIGPLDQFPQTSGSKSDDKNKMLKYNSLLPKFKAICQYIELCDENAHTGSGNPLGIDMSPIEKKVKLFLNQHKQKLQQQQQQLQQAEKERPKPEVNRCGDSYNIVSPTVFPWHKLLTPPPKQMVVIDRMHSGARRFVVLDFGSPILLTDLVIPACDELASLHIDIWCFDEDIDSVRLAVAPDISTKTLVLSDLQPPPIFRYMKITIIGRIGMSSTKCKIPLGSFYGHVVILENDAYGDPLLTYMKSHSDNIQSQIKALNTLYEDVHCRYSLASSKLMELLTPILNCELSNVAHMQAFINKQREEDSAFDNNKIVANYEECMLLQHQINVIRNVIGRLETVLPQNTNPVKDAFANPILAAPRDKLRVLSQSMIEILLHFSIDYGYKNILPVHELFTKDVANQLFHSLVVYGDAHIQLATCSLLVRMCCYQHWWGDFLADTFCKLFSSQNSKIFPQDRIFFLLTYLGRRSIAMGTCRSIVIDAVLKTLARLLAPISPWYLDDDDNMPGAHTEGLWSKSDLQLITWLLLFLSVCLDDNNDRKDKSINRWDFMSCETDFTKARSQSSNGAGKQLRCFKKRIIQQTKYNVPPYTDWGKKIFMIQNEHPGIFMELSGKPKASKPSSSSGSSKPSSSGLPKVPKEVSQENENNFDKGLKTIPLNNILIVIRGLIALLLEMDFTCHMDQFLLTCKVIARLVSACRPAVQLSKIITTEQLRQLIRLAVWNDQQQPWAVHAITCLLQDLLDADKQFKDSDATPTNDAMRPVEAAPNQNSTEIFGGYSSIYVPPEAINPLVTATPPPYTDSVKYSYLPSLIECEDTELFDEMLNDIDLMERTKPTSKKDAVSLNKNSFNYFCKSISNTMDSRLAVGLDLNIEIQIRRLTMVASLDMYSSLPQICTNEFINVPHDALDWPQTITEVWTRPEYDGTQNTYKMFKDVFDSILGDLHLQDTWVHLEQVLQMWLTLNGELSDKPYNMGISQNDIPKIPFGANAVQGLLVALTWHNDIKLRTWCLGFQCLFLACNSQALGEDDVDSTRINEVIINNENFEKMLLRFFSGYGMSSSIITNRCAGPTICKHLHDLIMWLHKKGEASDVISNKRKLKDTLLQVILQLVQPGGAISNQQGPIDAQSQLLRDVLSMPNDKADLSVSLNIIESVSFMVYNNISNGDKLQCQRASDINNSQNTFSSLFANVLGSENAKQNTSISDNSIIISLLKLSSSLVQTELPKQPSEVPIPEDEELSNETKPEDTKVEIVGTDGQKPKTPCIADTVLRQFSTMKRLLGSLSHCSATAITILASASVCPVKTTENTYMLEEPQTTADAVFHMLGILCEKATNPRLIVAPICQYLETSTLQHNFLPRLQLSEPFLWYISRVLESSAAVQIFTQLGGIKIICQNLVKLNKSLVNMQPGLISLIMQHMTKNAKLKLPNQACSSSSSKKSASSAQTQRNLQEGLINFAPFCTISSENDTAQSADILIMTPVSSHRRPRTPAWSYMFYPNESHVDLTISLPTAVLLKEVQLQPHAATLSSCPSAVSLEISRDYGVGPIPVGPPLTTTGMTCIRLKLTKAEIATSIILRLYRPKDSSNIGLTQIVVLGNTIFAPNTQALAPTGVAPGAVNMPHVEQNKDDDIFAKTNVGWVRILSRCFQAASQLPDRKLAADVIGASAAYPGFLESCCSLMNIMPIIPNAAVHNLEQVLLKVGNYRLDLCLSLIRILLYSTTPQTYKLSNEAICDLLYELATANDEHTSEKIKVLLTWLTHLRQHFSYGTMRCNNPQSGFVKVIASIFWTINQENKMPNLSELITDETFENCLYWVNAAANDEPLKVAFDSMLCSFCCIRPELFKELLVKFNVKLHQIEALINALWHANAKIILLKQDNNCFADTEWFKNTQYSLEVLLVRPAYLSTLAIACQSPVAIHQMVDSGLPKLLAHALYEYCCYLAAQQPKTTEQPTTSAAAVEAIINPAVKTSVPAELPSSSSPTTQLGKSEPMQPALKTDGVEEHLPPLLNCTNVPKILEFFSECCAEGHMRDWLGSHEGAVFWRPLLELLCNYRPIDFVGEDSMQQAFIRMERATINFFTKVTSCHPKNQDTLTNLLISVIRKPAHANSNGLKATISGFTRQIVLQLLLENERILVSVNSQAPLQRRDAYTNSANNTTSCACITTSIANHHPSKRVNPYHLLFYVSTNTKIQDILQNCVSESRQTDTVAGAASSIPNIAPSGINNFLISKHVSEKANTDCLGQISLNFSCLDNGMEFLSVAAGVTAKDKRIKDVKNQVAAIKDNKDIIHNFPKFFGMDDVLTPTSSSSVNSCSQLKHPDCPDVLLSCDATISQVLATLYSKSLSLSTPCITLNLINGKCCDEDAQEFDIKAANMEPLPSPLQRFSTRGGLSLLAQYLPTVYPDAGTHKTPTKLPEKEKTPPMTDWVKLEPNDEIYEDLEDPIAEPICKHAAVITSVPQHSLAAFGLFLRLPAYSDVLLRDKVRAQCLLRLVLGVTGDGEGNDIYSLSLAPSLPTLPFDVFRQLLDSSPLTTDDGMLLRRMVIEVGAMHLVLNCLGIFTHQSQHYQIASPQNEMAAGAIKATNSNEETPIMTSDDKSHTYWAKGTGFGTGSTAQSWNVEQALLRQKSEEEHVTVLLQVLSSYINPGDKIPASLQSDEILSYHEISESSPELPAQFLALLQQSCLIPALSSYLRNDSVLDITRHIPLYRSILQLLRALSLSQQLVSLLQPHCESTSPCISELLANMKTCVDTYAKRLKLNKKSNLKGQTQAVTVNIDDGDDEGLALLIPDIQETTVLVQKTTQADTLATQQRLEQEGLGPAVSAEPQPQTKSLEQRYMEVMKKKQFDTYDMIVESDNNSYRFAIAHHFEKMVRMSGDRYHPSRVKRLAQEAVTLSTSLPLSYSSSVFVRCDTDRLDIMKVLITGPADTPYANGCFEFDVFFPPDYPNLPMLINLETTGRHSVRFNPNLYNDGKVCLSVLNTWHGRPEEKWNAQTSSFLQVLVSIQSLILVPEPYFNEPGFERGRGTPSGTHSSREYNSNIYQACVRWAMLEQIRNPNPSFKDVIHTHFWLKRNEICAQIETWIEELSKPQYSERNSRTISFNSMVLRRQYRHLREELAKLKAPPGFEDLDAPFSPNVTLPAINDTGSSAAGSTATIVVSTDGTTQSAISEACEHPAITQMSSTGSSGQQQQVTGAPDPIDFVDVEMPTSPPSTSSSSDSTPIPLLVKITDLTDMDDAAELLPPQPPVPAPVVAKMTTVAITDITPSDDPDGDGEQDDGNNLEDTTFTDDDEELMQQMFFDDSPYVD